MLYELAHVIKEKFGFLWDMVEWGNDKAFSLKYQSKLGCIPDVLKKRSSDNLLLKEVAVEDCEKLAAFFKAQPESSFEFFKPHEFDEKSLKTLAKRKSQLMFIVMKEGEIVGYCFMRSFFNGQTYRGYMVDINHRGEGIAKVMGFAMNDVGDALGLKMLKSISPDNAASMAATKSVCDINILKTLDNGDLLVQCFSKK